MSSGEFETLDPQLWYEQAANAAVSLGAMGYGIHLAVFYKCISTISHINDPHSIRWGALVGTLFILGTSNIACSLRFNQLAFVDERRYPHGPAAFLTEQQSNSANVGAVATSIMITIFSGIFMIYRVQILWKKFVATAILSVVLLASVVMSILHAVQLTKPDSLLGNESSVQFSVPYVSLATALNILITAVLIPRLLELRRQVSRIANDTKKNFTTIEALVMESAFPSGFLSLIFIILYGSQKVASILFLPLLVQVMAIMPGLIILRIVRGYGWSNEVVRRLRASGTTLSGQDFLSGDPRADNISLGRLGNEPIGKQSGGFA